MTELLESGQGERLKATVHSVTFGLMTICAIYNTAAFLARRERNWHLAANAIGYGAVAYYEWLSIQHHLECERGDAS